MDNFQCHLAASLEALCVFHKLVSREHKVRRFIVWTVMKNIPRKDAGPVCDDSQTKKDLNMK